MTDADLIAGLRPELASKAMLHRSMLETKGIHIVFTGGFRSPAQQTALYALGRHQDPVTGAWALVDPSLVVTNALPNQGPHCRGAAYDLVPVVNERAVWDRLDLFAVCGEVGKSLGLVWGGDFMKLKDCPHFELPGWRYLPVP